MDALHLMFCGDYLQEQQEQTKHKKESSKELEQKYMRKEKELVKKGKKPFFLKKCMFRSI